MACEVRASLVILCRRMARIAGRCCDEMDRKTFARFCKAVGVATLTPAPKPAQDAEGNEQKQSVLGTGDDDSDVGLAQLLESDIDNAFVLSKLGRSTKIAFNEFKSAMVG